MTVINTNIKALQSQNAITANNRVMTTTMQQLSTGKRINTAGDDAAGLAIVSKMTSQIRGLDQAVRNANDGISLLQTAEGALVEVSNMLQRMRELSVQSASDTNTLEDRGYLNDEFQQLKAEIDRIAENTQWNGMNILNGNDNFGSVDVNEQKVRFQVGANASQVIDVNFKDFTFTPGASAASASKAQMNLATITTGAELGRFTATIGGVNVDVALAAAPAADVTAGNATAMATDLQAKIRTYSGLEGVTVEANDEVLTFTNPSGGAFSAFLFKKADNSAVTVATSTPISTFTAGAAGAGAAPAGSVFSGGAAINALTITGTTSDAARTNANASVTALDLALKSVNDERSKLGSVINRLNYAVDNLTNVSQNASASRSRVEDTDYAKASAELARTQIISQAATAMLAQANQQPQSVLQLLQG
jgi:flagellin